MRKDKPLSLKVSIIMLVAVICLTLLLLFAVPSRSTITTTNILPDAELPWNKSVKDVVETLDKIYKSVDGSDIKWALCETDSKGLYQMCLKDSQRPGPFRFSFSRGKLVGYMAEFSESDYVNLIYSGKINYRGQGHGVVKTQTREFRVYEMDINSGHLELYMVWDKDLKKIRVQTKYKFVGQKEKTIIRTPVKEDEAWQTESILASATQSLKSGTL